MDKIGFIEESTINAYPLTIVLRGSIGGVTICSESIPVAGPSREVIDEVLELDNRSLRITCLSIGNPHCMVLTNMISEARVSGS